MYQRPPEPDIFARLVADLRRGDKAAADRLVELLYPELRKLASARMRGERAEHTWQPTLLVNELYLALVKAATGECDSAIAQLDRAFMSKTENSLHRLAGLAPIDLVA